MRMSFYYSEMKTDYDQMTALCGLDCFNCVMYLANENHLLI